MKKTIRLLACSACVAGQVLIGTAHATTAWTFTSTTEGWVPRSGTSIVLSQTTTGDGKKSLHIAGSLEPGEYNYAMTYSAQYVPVTGGQWYRVSALVRINSLSGEQRARMYCQTTTVTQFSSSKDYDLAAGGWQELWFEFKAPDGADKCALSFSRGSSASSTIDADIDEIRMESITESEVGEKSFALPTAAKTELDTHATVHPRLFFSAADFLALQSTILPAGIHYPFWLQVKGEADRLVTTAPPTAPTPDDDGQIWQIHVGDAMPYLAMAYRLTGNPDYLEALKDWVTASMNYPSWGQNALSNKDVTAAHQLTGLAVAYDWCGDDLEGLEPGLKSSIKTLLLARGHEMYMAAARENIYWHQGYLNNHLTVSLSGLGTAGMALFEEGTSTTDPYKWVGMALRKIEKSLDSTGPDGASHEGITYWQYNTDFLLKFLHNARTLLDVDLYQHDSLVHAVDYGLYMTTPRASWLTSGSGAFGETNVDIGDSPRTNTMGRITCSVYWPRSTSSRRPNGWRKLSPIFPVTSRLCRPGGIRAGSISSVTIPR